MHVHVYVYIYANTHIDIYIYISIYQHTHVVYSVYIYIHIFMLYIHVVFLVSSPHACSWIALICGAGVLKNGLTYFVLKKLGFGALYGIYCMYILYIHLFCMFRYLWRLCVYIYKYNDCMDGRASDVYLCCMHIFIICIYIYTYRGVINKIWI